MMQPVLEKKICVLGLGYIGLPTAALLASRGYTVYGVEVNPRIAEVINSGRAHVIEPDLDLLVKAAVQMGKLRAHAAPAPADIFIICVPTPATDDHRPDLSHVFHAVRSICPFLKRGDLVVLESTSPPGTTEQIAELIRGETSLGPSDVRLAHAPERVLPGHILREVVENDRVIGGIDEASTAECATFYRTFVSGELLLTSARTAETVKLVENSFRDVNIAFANELSMLTDELKLDVWEVIRLANRHPRVNILTPGCGVGGHCIAVDPWFLIHRAPAHTRLMRCAREVNAAKPQWVVQQVRQHAEKFKSPRIACLGLSYKPDTDDLRESPALHIVQRLIAEKVGQVHVVEPNIRQHPEIKLSSLSEALNAADIVVILVRHQAFEQIAPDQLADKVVVDTVGLLS